MAFLLRHMQRPAHKYVRCRNSTHIYTSVLLDHQGAVMAQLQFGRLQSLRQKGWAVQHDGRRATRAKGGGAAGPGVGLAACQGLATGAGLSAPRPSPGDLHGRHPLPQVSWLWCHAAYTPAGRLTWLSCVSLIGADSFKTCFACPAAE